MAHSKRCPYCSEIIRWPELECEHIIPQSLEGDRPKLEGLLRDLGLASNYSLDSLDNLLPAHRRCNQQKSNHAELGYLIHFRSLARRKLERVQALLEEEKQLDVADEGLVSISHSVDAGALDPEQVYDSITRSVNPFPHVSNMETNPIQLSRSRVLLHCHLPTVAEPEGHLTVTFRHVELRSMQLNIGHEEIVRILFRSLGAPPSPRFRSFISKHDKQTGKFLMELVGATFPLSEEEMSQFCECVDLLGPLYLGAFRQIEEAISATNFEMFAAGEYRLQRIPRKLWALMLKYAYEHDLAKGTSEWHVFDANNGNLRLIWRTKEEWGYRAMIYPEREGEAHSLAKPDDQAWLCWSLADNKLFQQAKHTRLWDVTESHAFVASMVPMVLKWAETKGTVTKEIMQSLEEEQRWNDECGETRFGAKQLSKRDFQAADSAVRWFGRMQTHYLDICHDFIPSIVVDSIMRLILQVMDDLPNPRIGIDYFYGKLGLGWNEQHPNPRAAVERRRLEFLNEKLVSGDDADNCLRSLGWWLDGTSKERLRSFSFKDHYVLFEPLVAHFNQTRYLTRLQCWSHELR